MSRGISIGALMMTLAVAMGAFGAHALRGSLDAYAEGVYEKAVFYHFVHGLGILIVSSLGASSVIAAHVATRIIAIFLAGICFFSGSLYLLAISGLTWLGAITPIGGTLFILGWLMLARAAGRRQMP